MPDTAVDLAPFRARSALPRSVSAGVPGSALLVRMESHVLGQLGYGLDPDGLPVDVLRRLMRHPAVALAWRTCTGIVRRQDLYSVAHPDPKVRAEIETWLWPLLPRVTAAAARAFAYGGVVPVVLDWARGELRIVVERKGRKPRRSRLADHTHYKSAHELHPDRAMVLLDEQGEVSGVSHLGTTYGRDRVIPWAWDPEFGEPHGQGAARRAWMSYCRYLVDAYLRDKYLERSVDSPRVTWSPEGKEIVDGVEKPIPEIMGEMVDAMRGSGSLNLPGKRDNNGHRLYDITSLDLPDRHEVWSDALNRCEAEMFIAFFVSPTFSGGMDDAGGAASRTLEGMLKEHVEDIATWIAQGLTDAVQRAFWANERKPDAIAPEVVATDVGKAGARKIMLEVLRHVNAASRGEISFLADVPKILDRLGIPVRDEGPDLPPGWSPEETTPADDGAPGVDPEADASTPGRDREPAGDREQRRDDARTESGEEDTGAPRDEDEEA